MWFFTKYSATLQADVTCRGYVGILLSARARAVNQGGTADNVWVIRPWQKRSFCQGRFCFFQNIFVSPPSGRGNKNAKRENIAFALRPKGGGAGKLR